MDDASDSLLGATDDNRDGGTPIFVPIALALIGVALGGLALYFALTGGKEEEFSAKLSESGSQVATLEKRITELSAKNDKLQHDFDALEKQVRSIAGQTQSALNQVGQEILSTRRQISDNAEALRKVVEALNSGQSRPAASRPAATASTSSGASTSAQNTASGEDAEPGFRTHVIASGETFASISQQYGVPLQKVLESNPEADPRRLRIGQKIKVPLPADE
ncbi:LysM domain-containing protein [Ruficoccus sp. ZRK36]|uniref:LysM peptidoglycan-binding domain-containing protein n=1 Tax=Ruficoccus sp. ZRK36 TaxID=2866311 RepID=UPI001C73A3E6|nr:LysM domain-containing protein [Ruficoccus sp. ZRK36]QYY36692.1 LysM peptidoglycan-binding domain-containing protein [Ruficoccus sp. ZRK36]